MRTTVPDESATVTGVTARPKTSDTLVSNLRMLMREWPMTIDDLAKKSGVTKRMIQYVLNKERVPSIDVAAALACAFGINGWQLLVPNLKGELARRGQLEKLVQNYQRANADAQRYLDGVAERESTYNSQK